MGEHEHGSMDTSEQERMFNGFIKVCTYVGVIVAVILIFLAIVGT